MFSPPLTIQVTKSDFNKICRTCLGYKDKMTLLQTDVLNMLYICTNIKEPEVHHFPNHICEICLNKITDFFEFKQRSEHADRLLRSLCDLNEKQNTSNNYSADSVISSCESDWNSPIPETPSILSPMIDLEESRIENDEFGKVSHNDDYCSAKDVITENVKQNEEADKHRKRHVKTHKRGQFMCKICNTVLINSRSLRRHMQKHDENSLSYKCEECDKKFYDLTVLIAHLKAHNKVKSLACNICKKLFMIQIQLDLHMKTHQNEKKLICNQCDEKFQFPSRLKRHLLKHTKGNNYPCIHCDKIFKNEVYLNNHTRRVHSGERNLVVCTICGKSVSHLKDHILTHSNEKPFKCTKCPKEFSNKKYLKFHNQRRHDVPEEGKKRPYLCSICGKGSLSTTALKKHYEHMHTPGQLYQCPICFKQYKTDKTVNLHIRYTHNDERRYPCTVCSKRLRTSTSLRIHMRTHTGERPYVCKICNKAFGQTSTLKTHMKVHAIDVEKSVKQEKNQID